MLLDHDSAPLQSPQRITRSEQKPATRPLGAQHLTARSPVKWPIKRQLEGGFPRQVSLVQNYFDYLLGCLAKRIMGGDALKLFGGLPPFLLMQQCPSIPVSSMFSERRPGEWHLTAS